MLSEIGFLFLNLNFIKYFQNVKRNQEYQKIMSKLIILPNTYLSHLVKFVNH